MTALFKGVLATQYRQSMEQKSVMKGVNSRLFFRWVHIICSIPIIGYIYSPFEVIPGYAPATRFVFVPVMLLSGLWMWKGHMLGRLVSKGRPDGIGGMKIQ